MLYNIILLSIFITWLEYITSSAWFVLRFLKSTIVDFIPIRQKPIYILSSRCMHKSLKRIRLNIYPPFILPIFNIFKQMCLISFIVHSYAHLNTVQLTVLKVIVFRENTGILSPGGSYDLSPVNNDSFEGITLVLVGIPFHNQLSWLKVVRKKWTRGTNTLALFLWISWIIRHY